MHFKKPTTMKNIFKTLAVVFCVSLYASCAKNNAVTLPSDADPVNPVSDFTDTVDASDGFTYHFNSLAKNFTRLEWRLGDDTLKTDTNITHTYLTTGQFTVDLATYSKTGNVSHKQVVINIDPDKVLQIEAQKTGVDGQLKFIPHLKGNIKTIAWTITAIDPSTGTPTTTTSSDNSPVATFAFGSFNNFSVTVTTDKNSVVTVSKNATTDGIVTDITQQRISFKSTNDNTDNSNENAAKLVDGNPDTKFGFYAAFPTPQIATLGFASAQTVKLYAIENGNDSESDRDPKEWVIEASNNSTDGTDGTWDIIDHQNLSVGFADYLSSIGQYATRYNRFFYYPIANPQPYLYYRWRIISTFQSAFQIEELRFYK